MVSSRRRRPPPSSIPRTERCLEICRGLGTDWDPSCPLLSHPSVQSAPCIYGLRVARDRNARHPAVSGILPEARSRPASSVLPARLPHYRPVGSSCCSPCHQQPTALET